MRKFPSSEIWLAHRVCYGETDCMGVVYYAQYLVFFERARSEYIRAKGISYSVVEQRGVYLPVRDAACRYRSPARYDDLIWIRAAVAEIGRASLSFIYEIWNENKTIILAEGSTKHAIVDSKGKPFAMPDWFNKLVNDK